MQNLIFYPLKLTEKILMYLFDLVLFFSTSSSKPDTVIANGEDMSSEEEKEDQNINVNMMHQVTDSLTLSNCCNSFTNSELFSGQVHSPLNYSVNGSNSYHSNEDDDDDDNDGGGDNENDHDTLGVEDNSIPTIYFSHTVEPKRVCILLTLLIFSYDLIINDHLQSSLKEQ